jgi:hypothetical protein
MRVNSYKDLERANEGLGTGRQNSHRRGHYCPPSPQAVLQRTRHIILHRCRRAWLLPGFRHLQLLP